MRKVIKDKIAAAPTRSDILNVKMRKAAIENAKNSETSNIMPLARESRDTGVFLSGKYYHSSREALRAKGIISLTRRGRNILEQDSRSGDCHEKLGQ